MKKILYSSLLFAGVSAIFGLCYYFSFKNALLHYNREAVEQNTQILQEILQSSGESERLLQQMMMYNEEVISAASTGETLRGNASYFLETVCLQSQTEERDRPILWLRQRTKIRLFRFAQGHTWRPRCHRQF